jgi:hypothetical protein
MFRFFFNDVFFKYFKFNTPKSIFFSAYFHIRVIKTEKSIIVYNVYRSSPNSHFLHILKLRSM